MSKEIPFRLLVAALAVAVSPKALTAQGDRFDWRGAIDHGRVLEVKGISGDIRAVLATGGEAEVVAVKRGRSRYFDEVDFEVVEDRDGITICAVYPQRRGGWIDCEPGGWRNVNIRDTHVDVDFTVHVPAGVHFVGRTISGHVEAEDLRSPVVATTVDGDIYVSTTDLAEATTVSGSIDVSMGRAEWDGDLDFNTVSGDITVTFPGALDAEVSFESLSGDFESDFPVTVVRQRRGRWIGGSLRGTIGDGGRRLWLKTVSGDVWLRRGR